MRTRHTPADQQATIAADPHVIHPDAVYFPEDVRRLFRLKASTIRSEKRAGRLRVAKRAGRYFILGAWLLEWLRSGEMLSNRPPME